jgi:hypothetical protein
MGTMAFVFLPVAAGMYASLLFNNPLVHVLKEQEAGELDGYPALMRLAIAVLVSLLCTKVSFKFSGLRDLFSKCHTHTGIQFISADKLLGSSWQDARWDYRV